MNNDHKGWMDPLSGPLGARNVQEAYAAGLRDGVRDERNRIGNYRRELNNLLRRAFSACRDPLTDRIQISTEALAAFSWDIDEWASAVVLRCKEEAGP